MKIQEETITPSIAAVWLARNTRNRPLRQNLINTYCEDMANDRWQLNGETIKISDEGEILDGQHRLHAILKSKKTMRMTVVRGLPRESFHTIDTGMKRTGAQILGIAGISNATTVASACRWLVMLTKGKSATYKNNVAPPELFEAADRYPLVHHFSTRHMQKGIKNLLPSACMSVMVLASEKYGQQIVDDFMNAFGSGEGLKKADPVYELRERLIANSTRVAKLTLQTVVAITVKAVRAYAQSKTVGVLRWSPNEEFPEI